MVRVSFLVFDFCLSIVSIIIILFSEGVFEPCYEEGSSKFKKSTVRCREIELKNPHWFLK